MTLAALVVGAAGPAWVAPLRPVELPGPELVVTVSPLAFGLTRPTLEPPALSPAPVPALEASGPGAPRFQTGLRKPRPPMPEVGPFACTLAVFGRGASLLECGIYRLSQGDLRAAREPLEGARDVGDADLPARALVWLGEVALAEGRHERAQQDFRGALDRGPPADLAAHAALGYGWTALLRGDLPEAARGLTRTLGAGPPPALALLARFLQGVVQLSVGRAEEAGRLWETVASDAPPGAVAEELLFWRGVAAARLGQTAPALQALDRFLGTASPGHPLRPDAIAQAAWVALGRGAPDDAVRRFLELNVAVRPDLRPQLHAGLVRAYLALGDFPRARDEAQRLSATPGSALVPATLLLVANDAVRRGADAEAERLYGQLRAQPLPPAIEEYVTYRQGEILERQGRVPEAQQHFRRLREHGRVEAVAQRAAYRLGLLALRTQNPGAARMEAEALLRAGALPDLREAVILLAAEAAGRAGDPNRAATLFRLALRDYAVSPRAGAARLMLGWALLADREPQSALREWQEAALASDLDVAAQADLAIAEVALRGQRETEALEALRALGRVAPAHPLTDTIALNRGILQVRALAYAEAVQELELLVPRLVRTPREPLLRRALGIARYHLGQYDAAERQFRQAAHWVPAEPSNWLGVGLAAFHQGRFGEADEALGRARLAAAPEVAVPAGYALVLVAARRRDAEGFRERATTFVDRYPTHPHASVLVYALAKQALEGRQLDQADGWVKRLVKEYGTSTHVDEALVGLAEAARERPELARDAYRALVARLGAGDARRWARLGLAEAAMALGAAAEAQQVLEALLAEAPASEPRLARAYVLLIRAYEAQGQRERVLATAEGFLKRFPQDPIAPAIQLTRGHLLLGERQWEPAQRALEAARTGGEPTVAAPAHVWLGELYRARDEHEAAIAAYLGATYLYPDTPWAARGLQGAAESYIQRRMPREAGIVLRKLAAHPGVDPALARWAQQALAQLAPITGLDPAEVLRRGAARP